jgi:hypothetical protein
MTAIAATTALAQPASSWGKTSLTLPPLGNLDAYISAVNRIPLLSADEERDFAQRLQKDNDLEAAGKLVMSHLRLVVSVSRQYLGYGLPHGDLIQEGNVGLMKAVKRFNPDQGVRLVSYALHWIKAEIHEYILLDEAHHLVQAVAGLQVGHHVGSAPAWSGRMRRVSASITSRSAPTCGARSVLLMTNRSLLVMPGPPLRGIFSPAATSIT